MHTYCWRTVLSLSVFLWGLGINLAEAQMGCPKKEFQEIQWYLAARGAYGSGEGSGRELGTECSEGWNLIEMFHPQSWLHCLTDEELRALIQAEQAPMTTLLQSLPPLCGSRCTVEDYEMYERWIAKLDELKTLTLLSQPDFPCTEGLDLMELFSPYKAMKCTHRSGFYDIGKSVRALSTLVLEHCGDEFRARHQ